MYIFFSSGMSHGASDELGLSQPDNACDIPFNLMLPTLNARKKEMQDA